jgi:hypothetical protein
LVSKTKNSNKTIIESNHKKKTENQQTWSGPTMLTSKKRGGCGGRRRSMNWLDPSDSTKSGKKKTSKLQGVLENWSKLHQGK